MEFSAAVCCGLIMQGGKHEAGSQAAGGGEALSPCRSGNCYGPSWRPALLRHFPVILRGVGAVVNGGTC